MFKSRINNFSWNFYSKLIILSYLTLQIIHWQRLPYFMDIYYHLLTAWGFIKAGGLSAWDFWQYAPVGRIHIYPPFFHIVLAAFIKLGADKIILAKLFEVVTPVVFLIVLWNFTRKNFSERKAFFVILVCGSSFSFYLSLLNHIPATLALIFGFLAYGQLFKNRQVRSLLLLTLCFYTHIGISLFFALSLIFYGLFYKEFRKACLSVITGTFILSLPILSRQVIGLKFISALGLSLNERYTCQIKFVDCILAFFGLISIFKAERKYRLFLGFFLASLIFLTYPYRFFSAEGYLPVIFLSACAIDGLYNRAKDTNLFRYTPVLAALFILLVSPTLSMEWPRTAGRQSYKIKIADSAFLGMLLAKADTIWFPKEYISAAELIKDNSGDSDIIYSSFNIISVALASISGRSSANGLFPEIKPSRQFDPILASKIIVFTQSDRPDIRTALVDGYRLVKIGENRLFILYKNPLSQGRIDIRKAVFPFWAVFSIIVVFISLYMLC